MVPLSPPVERGLALVSGRKRPWKWFHAPSPAGNGRGTGSKPPCGRRDALELLPSRGAGCAELWNCFFGLLRPEMGLGTGSKPLRWPSRCLGSDSTPSCSLRRPVEVVPCLAAGRRRPVEMVSSRGARCVALKKGEKTDPCLFLKP